jgi:hypothetical protein
MKPTIGKLKISEYLCSNYWWIDFGKRNPYLCGNRHFKNIHSAKLNAEHWAKKLNIKLIE